MEPYLMMKPRQGMFVNVVLAIVNDERSNLRRPAIRKAPEEHIIYVPK
jgi:hypothetical protein